MSPKTQQRTEWALASAALHDGFTDFMLSRQAMRVSKNTLAWYGFTAGKFIAWLQAQGVASPEQVDARIVRAYQAELSGRGLSDRTLHGYARAIKTLLRFWHAEGYTPSAIKVTMPKIEKKRLPVLSAEQVVTVITACRLARDKALLLFAVDTGLRLAELVSLNWANVDMTSGLVHLPRGKGGKARTVIAGAAVRRALLAYRRGLSDFGDNAPLFQTDEGGRFAKQGLAQVFKRLSRRAGVKFSAHALRRTFCILSLRAGMDVLHLQALMGHSSLEMTRDYAQMVDDDLLTEHKEHSPIDNLPGLRAVRHG